MVEIFGYEIDLEDPRTLAVIGGVAGVGIAVLLGRGGGEEPAPETAILQPPEGATWDDVIANPDRGVIGTIGPGEPIPAPGGPETEPPPWWMTPPPWWEETPQTPPAPPPPIVINPPARPPATPSTPPPSPSRPTPPPPPAPRPPAVVQRPTATPPPTRGTVQIPTPSVPSATVGYRSASPVTFTPIGQPAPTAPYSGTLGPYQYSSSTQVGLRVSSDVPLEERQQIYEEARRQQRLPEPATASSAARSRGGQVMNPQPGSTAAANDPMPQPLSAGGSMVVRRGETMRGLAQRVYGDGGYYPRLQELNPTLGTWREGMRVRV